MTNIEVFNTIVGFVLADLYEAFPVPINLRAPKYAVQAGLPEDPEHLQFNDSDPAAAAITWLLQEGFIRAADNNSDGFLVPACVLSHKGLQLLSMPESIDRKESFGSRIMTAAKSGSIDGVKDLSKTLMLQGSKLAFKIGMEYLMQP